MAYNLAHLLELLQLKLQLRETKYYSEGDNNMVVAHFSIYECLPKFRVYYVSNIDKYKISNNNKDIRK